MTNFILKKLMYKLDAETAHNVFNVIFSGFSYFPQFLNYYTSRNFIIDKELNQTIFGKTFLNPVGLASGFDKNATIKKALLAFGFSHLEFGTVTKKAQSGNAKPRLFRYVEDESLQNAMGFNNDGELKISKRIKNIYPFCVPIGVNIGKNKDISNKDAKDNYIHLINTFKDISDYIVLNISSPNTKDLRSLQNKDFLEELFLEANKITKKPILVKISPDMKIDETIDLCNFAVKQGASGIIATNTTSDYSVLDGSKDFGGLSGKVLGEKSFSIFKEISKELFGKTTLISVGGILSGRDAYERLLYGASLVQIYSALVFNGMSCVKDINYELLKLLRQDGYNNVQEAIGAKL